MPTDQLRKLVAEAALTAPIKSEEHSRSLAESDAALAAVRNLNGAELEGVFSRAALTHGQHGLLESVVAPLAVKVGDQWRDGLLTAAHEHFASAVIRNFLVRNSRPYALNGHTPTLIVGTPAGQLHEIGAVMVAAAANDMRWRIIYLGTSLPAVEIAGAAIQNQVRAVALSIVFPGDDPNLPAELENLRQLLPGEIKIIVGGRAAESYDRTLKKIGASQAGGLSELYAILERLRAPAA